MKRARDIERMVQDLRHPVDASAHDRIVGRLLGALKRHQQTQAAARQPHAGRNIMKNPMTKLAVGAAIIAAVVLGLFEFISTDTGSGVVWADVAQKVQACQGVIYRGRETDLNSPDTGDDYSIHYLSSTKSRFDAYKDDEITKTFYDDFTTKTSVFVGHGHKSYIRRTVEGMKQDNVWTDPKSLLQKFLSHEYRELGQETVEGVLCEGIETTDAAFAGSGFPIDSLTARIWVSVETRYPVRFEANLVANGGEMRFEVIVDQFQWDVELDESLFEPNIPADYINISP